MALPLDKEIAPPQVTRTYEVQRHTEGRWLVDSVSDDKDVAIELAKTLMSGRRPPSGVRVMAVMLTDSGTFSEVSVYRSTMLDQGREAAPKPKPKIEAKPARAGEQRDFKRSDRPPAPKPKGKFQNLIHTLQLALGIGVMLAGVEALYLMMR